MTVEVFFARSLRVAWCILHFGSRAKKADAPRAGLHLVEVLQRRDPHHSLTVLETITITERKRKRESLEKDVRVKKEMGAVPARALLVLVRAAAEAGPRAVCS